MNKILLFTLLLLLGSTSLIFGQKTEEIEYEKQIIRIQKNEIEQRMFGNLRKHELLFQGSGRHNSTYYEGRDKEQEARQSFEEIEKFIYSNLKFNQLDLSKAGTVIIQFSVQVGRLIENATIIKDSNGNGEELLRIVKMMTHWEVGSCFGWHPRTITSILRFNFRGNNKMFSIGMNEFYSVFEKARTSESQLIYSAKIDNRLLHLSETSFNQYRMKSINLRVKEAPRLNTFARDIWKAYGDDFFVLRVSQLPLSLGTADLSTRPMEQLDSLSSSNKSKRQRKEFDEQYGHLNRKERIRKKRDLGIFRIYAFYEKNVNIASVFSGKYLTEYDTLSTRNKSIYNQVYLDFIIENMEERKFKLFFRFDDYFVVGEFIYPRKEEPHNKRGEWKEIKIYNRRKAILLPIHVNDIYPTEKVAITKYDAIKEEDFFEGEFKVIKQGALLFLVNEKHGGIYHLGENQITKVGQIELKDYVRKMKDEKLFIEDLDEGELIFFAPVKKISEEVPFPKVRILVEESEVNEFFKNI